MFPNRPRMTKGDQAGSGAGGLAHSECVANALGCDQASDPLVPTHYGRRGWGDAHRGRPDQCLLRIWTRRCMALARRRPCSCLVLGLKIGRTAPVLVFDTAAWYRPGLLCGVSVRRFGRLRQVWCIGHLCSLLCSDQREDDSNSKARNGDSDGPSGAPEPATLPLRQLLDGIKEGR